MLELDIKFKFYPDRSGCGKQHHTALRDLHLHLRHGEFVCLVGPSGCGKSTLLNLIGGIDADFSGQIRMDGNPAPRPTPGHNAGIGFMFQTPRLMPWLNVLDNVRLVLNDTPEDNARARELLNIMELGDVLNAYPGRLSGGMQRRVALARAFAIKPRLLLMDEPFVSLDAPTADRLRAMLIQLQHDVGSTVLFVTHDLREALHLADRVCFLSSAPGRIIHEHHLTTPRPRSAAALNRLTEDLLHDHPDVLSGLLTQPAQPVSSASSAQPAQLAQPAHTAPPQAEHTP